MLVSVTALVCLAGSLTAYFWYDKATTPERGTPAVALEQYISTKFSSRDEARARLFVCSDPTLDAVEDLLRQIKEREAQTKAGFTVTLSDLSVVQDNSSATIETNLNIAAGEVGGASSLAIQRWEFKLVESDGWRVCTAKKLS
ncbi:hypothetical protein [Dactylosporangium fulvum]|uniref:hypothetical protein n=1 Tax=Dactylosporangium fulvum TaxID=53359 RepID=UPI0031E1FD39